MREALRKLESFLSPGCEGEKPLKAFFENMRNLVPISLSLGIGFAVVEGKLALPFHAAQLFGVASILLGLGLFVLNFLHFVFHIAVPIMWAMKPKLQTKIVGQRPEQDHLVWDLPTVLKLTLVSAAFAIVAFQWVCAIFYLISKV
jgi:hypothetical protein